VEYPATAVLRAPARPAQRLGTRLSAHIWAPTDYAPIQSSSSIASILLPGSPCRCLDVIAAPSIASDISKFAYVELHEKATTRVAADFLRASIKAVPYKAHTVLTDNGAHFTTPGNKNSTVPDIKRALETGEPFRAHAFEFDCAQNDIDHRLTKPKHP
jgi:hypothetical protein